MKSRHVTALVITLLASLARADDEPPKTSNTVTNSIGMKLKLITAGNFPMGNPDSDNKEDRLPDRYEKPQHRVRISRDYFLGVMEVTQGQWEAVMGTRPWIGQVYVNAGTNYPATWLSWVDAVQFCKRLGEKESVTYRLPTEAEWEYACRAGTTTEYSFGDDATALKDYAWFRDNAFDRACGYAHQVGTKQPNSWGLYDMHGNVLEYCQDWYGAYKSSAAVDPVGPSKGSVRVVRRGCLIHIARLCTSSDRYHSRPSDRRSGLRGFRVVRGPLPVKKPASEAKSESQSADQAKAGP